MSQQDPEAESSTDHLPRMISVDPLIGLLLCRSFEEQYVKLFERARAEEKPLSLAIFDIVT